MTEYAFPRPVHADDREGAYLYTDEGMTLRDYFAAAALTGILANNIASYSQWNTARAYEHADEMLKARGGG